MEPDPDSQNHQAGIDGKREPGLGFERRVQEIGKRKGKGDVGSPQDQGIQGDIPGPV